ncbi:MAG: Imm26 family immunity protein [Alysiella sp.]|nr:Imm26 family immunity protein [Alysiella sp.]
MLRYIKIGDIVCFETDHTGKSFGYGQLIAQLETGGFVFKAMNIIHQSPNDITVEEIVHSDTLGKPCVLDVYSTLDRKKHINNGEWRIIGRENDFKIKEEDLNTIYFIYGIGKGFWKKINLLNEVTPISDEEAEKYLDAGLNTGDQVKIWYVQYDSP